MDMDKSASQYGSPPAAGFAPPPGYSPSNAYPTNTYPPNTYPPNAYPPNPQQTTTSTVVITGGPTLVSFGPGSQPLVCPYCHHSISTRVENKATTKTHLCALLLCLCLCWPCCCCPYCMDSCQGRDHFCPQCNAFLGTYSN